MASYAVDNLRQVCLAVFTCLVLGVALGIVRTLGPRRDHQGRHELDKAAK